MECLYVVCLFVCMFESMFVCLLLHKRESTMTSFFQIPLKSFYCFGNSRMITIPTWNISLSLSIFLFDSVLAHFCILSAKISQYTNTLFLHKNWIRIIKTVTPILINSMLFYVWMLATSLTLRYNWWPRGKYIHVRRQYI